MATDETKAAGMYCRGCGYQLAGLSENRCPDCGHAFDPAKGSTYLHHRHSWAVRRCCRRIGTAIAAVMVLAVVGLVSLWGYTYWKYHADWLEERRAIAALNAYVCGPCRGAEGPIRVESTDPKQILADVEFADWSPWYWLDEWLDRLCWPVSQFRIQVKEVNVRDGTDLTDADLANLAAFKHVQTVNLDFGMIMEDTPLTKVTDAGLASLAELSELHTLYLCRTNITDSGLVHLYGLENLSELNVTGTKVTEEGIRQLQRALPGVKVEGP